MIPLRVRLRGPEREAVISDLRAKVASTATHQELAAVLSIGSPVTLRVLLKEAGITRADVASLRGHVIPSGGPGARPQPPDPSTLPDERVTWAEASAILKRSVDCLRRWSWRYGVELDGSGLVSPRVLAIAAAAKGKWRKKSGQPPEEV